MRLDLPMSWTSFDEKCTFEKAFEQTFPIQIPYSWHSEPFPWLLETVSFLNTCNWDKLVNKLVNKLIN